ncbi:NAD(P)-dependent oxidoreductase [Paenibacillus mesophilus]|uniref:NAD-dependent epimerase/dehydratase family protein n=1 Tax=Paenibacillus mesophilus TaxID=2582849 RepID=UPI00110E7CC3|nr:NAD(P)-dependent oxidoreductase [Paenibacillus mesophilus]TMV49077.1 NAD(P)-dependent oxidoreductase [Paenibacillus mesophilus]
MMAILITGANGKIGSKLLASMIADRELVCFSRKRPPVDATFVKGNFDCYEDLCRLDGYRIDTVIHLAAVQTGFSEEEIFGTNILGTRRLFRYLIDKGCRKFISISSIAAVGCLDRDFFPQRLPIADDHPCLATDAYGASKAMVEELNNYFSRRSPGTDFINLRLGSVVENEEAWAQCEVKRDSTPSIPFANLSKVLISDVIRAIETAVDAPLQYGARTYNVVGRQACCDHPVTEILERLFGERFRRVDSSYYEKEGGEKAPLFSMTRIKNDLGFEPLR